MFLRKIEVEGMKFWMEKLEALDELVRVWNTGCSAQKSHLYLTGAQGSAWSSRDAPMTFPERKEWDFWYGFSRNKNTTAELCLRIQHE